MTTIHWFILIGSLMLARGLAATTISRSPFTSAIVYLGVGLLLGPVVFNVFHFDPVEEAHLLETLTEVAVLISLFSAGVKMPVPITRARWAPAVRLAFVSMAISVGLAQTAADGLAYPACALAELLVADDDGANGCAEAFGEAEGESVEAVAVLL